MGIKPLVTFAYIMILGWFTLEPRAFQVRWLIGVSTLGSEEGLGRSLFEGTRALARKQEMAIRR
jgi:hypothetical protein